MRGCRCGTLATNTAREGQHEENNAVKMSAIADQRTADECAALSSAPRSRYSREKANPVLNGRFAIHA
jgi:hypothetical protein